MQRPTGEDILAQAEIRDDWLALAVVVAVALLLGLLLIIIRRRRNPDTTLPGLFRAHRASDIARWVRERIAAFDAYREERRARTIAIEAEGAREAERGLAAGQAKIDRIASERARLEQLASQRATRRQVARERRMADPSTAALVEADEIPSEFSINGGVAICASISVVVLYWAGLWVAVHDVGREIRHPSEPYVAFGPHVLALAAAVTGFRTTANVVAIVAALGWGFLSGVMVLLSVGTSVIADGFFALQIALLLFAATDLWRQGGASSRRTDESFSASG